MTIKHEGGYCSEVPVTPLPKPHRAPGKAPKNREPNFSRNIKMFGHFGELNDAIRHWRWMQCGADFRYERLEERHERFWDWPPTITLVVAAGRRVPDPSMSSLTKYVQLDHRARFGSSAAGFGCPLLNAPRYPIEGLPTTGFCDNIRQSQKTKTQNQ